MNILLHVTVRQLPREVSHGGFIVVCGPGT